jgi:hypothetical protein
VYTEVTEVARLQQRLQDLQPIPKPRDTLGCLPVVALRLIAAFTANTFRGVRAFAALSRATHAAATHNVTRAVLVPFEASVEAISRHGALDSLATMLAVGGRGQRLTELRLVASESVYAMPPMVRGPEVAHADLMRLVSMAPRVSVLDLRGIVVRRYRPWADTTLADIARLCPRLQSLRVGVAFARAWQRGWWAPLADTLTELVIGSRREDVDWVERSHEPMVAIPTPPAATTVAAANANAAAAAALVQAATAPGVFVVPEDLFVLARTAPLASLKIWAAMAPTSVAQLLQPAQPLPRLTQLSVLIGPAVAPQLLTAELDAAVAKERAEAEGRAIGGADATPGKNARGGGAGGAQGARGARAQAAEDALSNGPAMVFPSLTGITLADVGVRPTLMEELHARLSPAVAPELKYWNVVNTHRQGPTAAAQAAAQTRKKPAAAAAVSGSP